MLSLWFTSLSFVRNLSFQIKAGSKVGVVGRTGAGKSSLIAALFRFGHYRYSIFLLNLIVDLINTAIRIVEPSGQIIIDDVDALSVPLHELRRKIAIVPQVCCCAHSLWNSHHR